MTILDLEKNVKKWMGVRGFVGCYKKEVLITLRVLSDENKDTV